MTIIFGILQSDGIIFAADTEETGAFLKFSTPKLYSHSRANGEQLVIGGAGSPFSVETIQQRLGKSFVADSASFEEIAGTIIKQLYEEQVPVDANRDFWLIIGASFRTRENEFTHRLWIGENGCLRDAGNVAVVGAGAEIARILLKRYAIKSRLPIAELAAVHVLRLAKEQAHFCGKEDMIWRLCGPDVLQMTATQMQKAEDLSRRYDDLHRDMFSAFFANDASLRYINSNFAAIRGDYAKLLEDVTTHYTSEKAIAEHSRNNPEDI
jgi:20S proteasome alpha/beta subunit